MPGRFPVAAVTLTCLSALTACGSSEDDTPASDQAPTTVTASPREAPQMRERVDGIALSLTVDNRTVEATMVDNATSREFLGLLPLSIRMTDMLGREAYGGGLPEQRTDYEVGELVYWPPTNGIAVYYRVAGTPVPEPGLIPLARITEGVEAFDLSDGPARVTIGIAQ
ncbi:MAG: hypothetical protein EOP24_44320 [Hyphomicrobiales bacterium]|nr:MAG: hypothetical protein EOP24_44320 [Hyphomicrobiales bacterium]